MTPKEKAVELVERFINLYEGVTLGLAKKHWAKQSALIAVDEMIEVAKSLTMETQEWYEEVKEEIENL
jgi:DnaJ-domain-containing protein 1